MCQMDTVHHVIHYYLPIFSVSHTYFPMIGPRLLKNVSVAPKSLKVITNHLLH